MKTKLFYILFLATLSCLAQPKDIELPIGGEEMKISKGTFFLSFYITKNQEVYLEDKKISFYNDIAPMLTQAIRTIPDNFHGPKIYYIYADVNVAYKFVDKIKTEIGRIVYPRIDYKTDSYENIMTTMPSRINGSVKGILRDDKIFTLKEQQKNEEAAKEMMFPPPPPPPAFWQETFQHNLYQLNANKVAQTLKEHSSETLTILPNGEYKYKGENYKFTNTAFLKDLHLKHEILFLRYGENLSYGDYIKAKQQLRKIGIAFDKEKKPSAYKIEISFALEEKLKEKNLRIF